jgi:myosin heavy subunit
MKATSISNTDLRNLSQQEFVATLTKKIKTMQEENDSMYKTIEQAKVAIRERKDMERTLKDTVKENARLEAENLQLGEKIRELRAEVKSSRAYIDKLLKTSHETKHEEWEKHEEQLMRVISNLRQQIRQQESSVSIDLYKSAVQDGRQKLTQLRIAESNIEKLKEKVAQLEKDKETRSSKLLQTPRATSSAFNPKRSVMFSPTDQIEKGLFNNVEEKNYSSALKEARTPKSQMSNVKTQNDKSQRQVDDLTGITISFENATSPRTPRGLFKRHLAMKKKANEKSPFALREIQLTNSNQLSNTSSSNQKEITDFQSLKPVSSTKNAGGDKECKDYFVPQFGKENTPKTPRSASKEIREKFGSTKALQDKLKKMRSPKMLNSATLPARQVHVIVH